MRSKSTTRLGGSIILKPYTALPWISCPATFWTLIFCRGIFCKWVGNRQICNSHHFSPVNLFQLDWRLQNIFSQPRLLLCWQKDKKRANSRKVCDVGNVECQKSFCQQHITSHYHISPHIVGQGEKDNKNSSDPIHLVADGSISVNVSSKRPIIITLYGSPNGPTRVQLAFSP